MRVSITSTLIHALIARAVDFQPGCCSKALADLRSPNSQLRDTWNYLPTNNYTCHQSWYALNPSKPANELRVPYWWCTENCPSYETTSGGTPPEWTDPMLQFLLPAVYFSMNVPRSLKFEIPDALFDFALLGPHALSILLVSLVVSGIIAILDVTLWIICVIACAGPMLFSGLTEALIDFKIVQWFKVNDCAHENRRRLNIPKRLDLEGLDPEGVERERLERLEMLLVVLSGNLNRNHNQPRHEIKRAVLINDEPTDKQGPLATRLRSMMASQASFGTTIGGPVLFYLGSMLYTVVSLRPKRGDNYTAHSLAYGLFWMIVIHVAIVSGCLLASNNPSTVEAITGLSAENSAPGNWIASKLLAPVYRSRYRPVWMWSRGWEKIQWLESTEAWKHDSYKNKIRLSPANWCFILIGTNVLLCGPCFAAAYVAYKTPRIGLSCRSMTFLTYYCAQHILILVAWKRQHQRRKDINIQNQRCKDINSQHQRCKDTKSPLKKIIHIAEYSIMSLATGWSVFAAAGSTFMQITGVYNNCKCAIPIATWWGPHNEWIPMSSDTEQDRISSGSWELVGYLGIGFLAFACYMGWWYQRYIRRRFVTCVENLGKPSSVHLPSPSEQPNGPCSSKTMSQTRTVGRLDNSSSVSSGRTGSWLEIRPDITAMNSHSFSSGQTLCVPERWQLSRNQSQSTESGEAQDSG